MKTVAIVIPCRNEEKYIAGCLDSILKQNYDLKLISVLICDGNSTDKTVSIVKKYTDNSPGIKLLVNEKQSTPFALNLGIKNSFSDFVVILGAHAELHPDFIKNSVLAFDTNSSIGCTGGLIENIYENKKAFFIGAAMSSVFGVGNAHFRTGNRKGYVDTVAFGMYKREVFNKSGFFDEELIRNQDDEFNYRLIKSGYKIYLDPEIRSLYYVRGSFTKLFRQYFQYGYWKVYVAKKHKAITTLRQLIPLLFVLFLILGSIASFLHPVLFYLFSSGLAAYLILAMVFAFRSTSSFLKLFPVIWSFLILHTSYGWGYLNGIFDFFIMRKKIRKEEKMTR